MSDAPAQPTTSPSSPTGNSRSIAVRHYIAVRSAGDLKDCIFLNWEAALPHLASISNDDDVQPNISSYKVFKSFVKAEQFITGEVLEKVPSPARRSTSKSTSRKTVARKTKSPAAATAVAVNHASGDSEQLKEAPAPAAAAEAASLLPPADSAAAAGTPPEEDEDEPARVARLLAAASNYRPSESWEQSYIKLAGLSVDGKLPERIDDEKIRDFYYRQHDEYRKLVKGEHSALSQQKYEKLLKIGFVFGTTPKLLIVNKKKFDGEFEMMIAKLKDFLHQHGHCNVLKSQKEHRALWNWMARIRADYKRLSVPEERNKCRLSTLQMQRLTELGFCFLTVAYKPWEDRLEDLKTYQAAGNDINKIPTVNHELGEFVGRCRKEYKHFLEGRRTAMTKERAQKLEEIGFDWNTHLHRDTATYPKPKSWEQRYQQLKEYYLEHGDTLVHKNHPDGLGRWVADQRKNFKTYVSNKQSSLNPEKVGKLVEIGFIVDANVYKRKRQKVEDPPEADEALADAETTWYI